MAGSLREKRPGVWELRVYLGREPLSGRKRYRSRTVQGGRRAAEVELAQLVTEAHQEGPLTEPATVAQLFDRWLDLAERDLSPTTLRNYRAIARKRVLPLLGPMRVEDVTAAHLDALYLQASQEVAPATVRRLHACIHRAFGQAVRWGWVRENVASRASPPPLRRHEVEPPSPAELGALLEAAPAFDPDLAVIVAVAAGTGMRRGELCGLRWDDVDLDDGEVVVKTAVVDVGGRTVEKAPKSHQRRRLALSGGLVQLLEAHRAAMLERADLSGVELVDEAFVWSRVPDCSEPLRPERVTKGWSALCRKVGVEGVRLHDLRHLHATTLIDAGVPVTSVSARLGHRHVSTTTDIYAHAVKSRDREAAEVMDRWVEEARRLGEGERETAPAPGEVRGPSDRGASRGGVT